MGGAKAAWLEAQERGWDSVDGKYVCAECFEDEAIKAVISQNAEERECSYCGRSSKSKPIAASMNCVMEEIYFGIRQEWGDPDNEGVPWESAEGGYQGNVIDSWDLLREELELGIANEDLFHDLYHSIAHRQWCQRDFWRLLPQKELAFDWRRFRDLVKHESRFVFLKQTARPDHEERTPQEMLELLGGYFLEFGLVKTLPKCSRLIRARRHKKTEQLTTLGQLGPPTKSQAIASNRMSPAGIPMFYGAFAVSTAIAEVCSDPTDKRPCVTSASFVLKRSIRVIDLCDLPRVPSLFDRAKTDTRAACIFLQSFLKEFTAPVVKDGREHVDYVPTQVVTEYVRRIFRTEDNQEVHGIVYPSAVEEGGRSCVLFIEGVAGDEYAHLNHLSIDKWLNLDKKGLKTHGARKAIKTQRLRHLASIIQFSS